MKNTIILFLFLISHSIFACKMLPLAGSSAFYQALLTQVSTEIDYKNYFIEKIESNSGVYSVWLKNESDCQVLDYSVSGPGDCTFVATKLSEHSCLNP